MYYTEYRYDGNCSMILAMLKCYNFCENNNNEFTGCIPNNRYKNSMSHRLVIRNIQPILKYFNLPNKINYEKDIFLKYKYYSNTSIDKKFCEKLHDRAKKFLFN